jgi:hypothetical protein
VAEEPAGDAGAEAGNHLRRCAFLACLAAAFTARLRRRSLAEIALIGLGASHIPLYRASQVFASRAFASATRSALFALTIATDAFKVNQLVSGFQRSQVESAPVVTFGSQSVSNR